MKNDFVFKKENYYIMFVGLAVLLSGFLITMFESAEYGFGFMGLTLGPIVILSGFAIEFFAIFYKKKKSNQDLNNPEL